MGNILLLSTVILTGYQNILTTLVYTLLKEHVILVAVTHSLTQTLHFAKWIKDFGYVTAFCKLSAVFCCLHEIFWEMHLQSWELQKCCENWMLSKQLRKKPAKPWHQRNIWSHESICYLWGDSTHFSRHSSLHLLYSVKEVEHFLAVL